MKSSKEVCPQCRTSHVFTSPHHQFGLMLMAAATLLLFFGLSVSSSFIDRSYNHVDPLTVTAAFVATAALLFGFGTFQTLFWYVIGSNKFHVSIDDEDNLHLHKKEHLLFKIAISDRVTSWWTPTPCLFWHPDSPHSTARVVTRDRLGVLLLSFDFSPLRGPTLNGTAANHWSVKQRGTQLIFTDKDGNSFSSPLLQKRRRTTTGAQQDDSPATYEYVLAADELSDALRTLEKYQTVAAMKQALVSQQDNESSIAGRINTNATD